MRIAICDDNRAVAEELRNDILKLQNISADVFEQPDALIFSAGDAPYDIIFMDIELGEESGIRLSEKLLNMNPDAQIIFISGYDDYYLDVYDVNHIYFLRKPVKEEKLRAALERAYQNLSANETQYIDITNRRNVIRIPQNRILFMEKNGRVIYIHTIDGEVHRTYGKFSDLLSTVEIPFFRCHNSFIVNFDHVLELRNRTFVVGAPSHETPALSKKHEVPISRSFYPRVRDAFAGYLSM